VDSRAKPAVDCRIRLTTTVRVTRSRRAPDVIAYGCFGFDFSGYDSERRTIGAARKGTGMALVIILLLLALLLGGLGFAIHVLWWIAIVVFVVFLVSLVLNRR
jgi:hypothetical protein